VLDIMQPLLKSVLVFLAKSLAFTVIFWTVWFYLQRSSTPAQSNDQAQAQMDAYQQLIARNNRQLDMTDALQKRTDANLRTQEALVARFDAVVRVWEKQTGLRK
jgi:biopolymer transport protein ExbB/TolQ